MLQLLSHLGSMIRLKNASTISTLSIMSCSDRLLSKLTSRIIMMYSYSILPRIFLDRMSIRRSFLIAWPFSYCSSFINFLLRERRHVHCSSFFNCWQSSSLFIDDFRIFIIRFFLTVACSSYTILSWLLSSTMNLASLMASCFGKFIFSSVNSWTNSQHLNYSLSSNRLYSCKVQLLSSLRTRLYIFNRPSSISSILTGRLTYRFSITIFASIFPFLFFCMLLREMYYERRCASSCIISSILSALPLRSAS